MKHWLEDIYREHRRGLFGLALSVVREPATAEDAVHEAFVRMAKQPQKPTGDAAAYAYRAVRNAAIDQARRRKTRAKPAEEIASLFVAPEQDDPSWSAQRNETQAMLKRAIDELPDNERELVIMRSFGGLTFQQIADAIGQPLSTVSSRYQNAIKSLRQLMENSHART